MWLCALGSIAPARAAEPPPAAAPSISVNPTSFRLWKDRAALLTLESPDDVDELRVTTSLGRLNPAARVNARTFTLAWRPPEQGFPQVALFCAHLRHGDTWRTVTATLPLWGLGDAVVRATKQSKITVRIGTRQYGPVVTDRTGTARVPVEVGPGERSALHGTREIPLNVPDGKRAHASTPVEFLWASQPSEVTVTLLAISPDGSAHPDGTWALQTDRGQVAAPVRIAPGVWQAAWSLPPGEAGAAHLTAKLDDVAAQTATLTLPVRTGPPARVELDASPAEIPAERPTVTVRARAVDPAGRPVQVPIQLTAPLCTNPTVVDRGEAGVEWTCALPNAFRGARSLDVSARTPPEAGGLRGSLSIPLRSGPAAQVVLEGAPRTVFADGSSSATLRVRAVDAWGNVLAPDVVPAVQVTPGDAAEVRLEPDAESGGQVAIVRPRDLDGELDASVALRYGAAEATAALALVGHRTLLSVAPRIGVVTNLSDVTAPEAMVDAVTLIRAGRGHAIVGMDVGVFGFSPAAGALRATGSTQYWPVLGEAGYRVPLGRVAITGFVEGGFARVIDALRVADAPEARSSGVTPMGAAGLKLEVAAWRGAALLDVRGIYAADPKLPTLSGAFTGVSAGVGYRFEVM